MSIPKPQAVFFALAVAFLPLARAQNTKLDRDIPALLEQNHVPSVSLAQIQDGKITLVRAYGKQDATTKATPRTLYNIASLTKPITAQVAMVLLSKGFFNLDEPLARLWADPDIATDERRYLLTPRIALTHQTGFPNWRSDTGGVLTFKFTPGTRYSYSGEGFEYLTRFMEKETRQPLDSLAQKLVFDPLGMHDTSFTRQPWFSGRVAVPMDDKGTWLTARYAERPISADMLYTTAGDYALLLQAILANTGVTPQIARERDTIQVSVKDQLCPNIPAALCPETVGSGLSWQVAHFHVVEGKDTTVLIHTGHDPGVYTFAYVSPTSHSGAVILTNGDNGRKLLPGILRDLDAPAPFVDLVAATLVK